MRKIIFPTLIIILFLAIDVFLINDLQIENEKFFPKFETVSIFREKITDKILEGKISVIYVWTTKQENFSENLSELEEIQKNFSEIQIIGLIGDIRSEEKEKFLYAKKISEKYSPTILQLTVNDNFNSVLEKIRTIPTIIFIDENKNFIGQPVRGENSKFIEREIKYILQKNSAENIALKKIHEIILSQ